MLVRRGLANRLTRVHAQMWIQASHMHAAIQISWQAAMLHYSSSKNHCYPPFYYQNSYCNRRCLFAWRKTQHCRMWQACRPKLSWSMWNLGFSRRQVRKLPFGNTRKLRDNLLPFLSPPPPCFYPPPPPPILEDLSFWRFKWFWMLWLVDR